MAEEKRYEVGYKKPPKSGQFKPGQSGNPKGRPRRLKDFDQLLDRELSETLRITDRGEIKTLSKREILVKTLTNLALKGDRQAIRLLVSLMQAHQTVEAFKPSAADRTAFFEYVKTMTNTGDDEDPADD